MRTENRNGEGECYQLNEGTAAVYSEDQKRLISLQVKDQPVEDNTLYSVCIPGFHFNNAERYLGVTQQEFLASGKTKVVATSAQQVLEEYLRNHQNLKKSVEGRLVYV